MNREKPVMPSCHERAKFAARLILAAIMTDRGLLYDLVRPLDDLIAKFGQVLQPNQLIKVDGKTVAIAFDANSQHLFYRKDVLDKAGVAAPKTYEDVLAAAPSSSGDSSGFYDTGGTQQDFMYWLKSGFAFTLPLLVIGLAILVALCVHFAK